MSKVFLISSNRFTSPYPVYPLGMAVIASALSEKGHIVHQFDLMLEATGEDRLEKSLREFAPDFVGISIRNIDDLDSLNNGEPHCLDNEKHLVSVIRKCTGAPVIIGGPAFSTLPEEILDYVRADYGVAGEGERIICDLIDTLNNGRPAPGIIRPYETPLKGEEICAPLWEKGLMEFYIRQSGMANLQTKRGCPYHCSYCVYPSLEGRKFRFRESQAVIEDLKRLRDLYDVDTVFFTDSIFNDPEGHYLELAEEIISSGLRIRWSGYFRPGGMGEKELALLKRSGLYAMEVGSDAGCDETLNNLKKGFLFEDILDFNRASVKAEIPSAHFFIFGGPGENEKTLNEGLKNIRALTDSVIFVYSGVRILPGTDLYRRALREGLLSENAPLIRPVFYFSPDMDIEFMNRTIKEESTGRREFIFPPYKGKMMIDAMKVLGHKGLLWDRLISFSNNSGRRRQNKGMNGFDI
jgi:lipid biosynthesis B12-binding/radical SAM protein